MFSAVVLLSAWSFVVGAGAEKYGLKPKKDAVQIRGYFNLKSNYCAGSHSGRTAIHFHLN